MKSVKAIISLYEHFYEANIDTRDKLKSILVMFVRHVKETDLVSMCCDIVDKFEENILVKRRECLINLVKIKANRTKLELFNKYLQWKGRKTKNQHVLYHQRRNSINIPPSQSSAKIYEGYENIKLMDDLKNCTFQPQLVNSQRSNEPNLGSHCSTIDIFNKLHEVRS